MTSYRFIGAYPRFYPDERNTQGQSLMAELDMVVEFQGLPPSDGQWIPVEVEASPVVTPEVPVAGPEPALEAPEPEPAPDVTPVAPEPAQAVSEPTPEPVPLPEPEHIVQPEPEPVPEPASDPGVISVARVGYVSPYARV